MKLDRLLAIVMLLLNRGRISAKELADQFEVSVRTIYRDIDAINQAGIPIATYQGVNGGIGILENYKIDRNVLTSDEISSIITALKGASTTMDDRKLSDALEKMKGLSGRGRQEDQQESGDKVIINFNPWGSSRKEKEKFNIIRSAAEEGYLISFQYINNRGECIDRIVEPMSLYFKGTYWYLYGYCRIRGDYRIFRLSRMRNLTVEKEKFIRRDKNITDLDLESEWGDRRAVELVLKFAASARVRVQDSYDEAMVDQLEDGSMLVRVTYPEDEWVYGTVLSYGPDVEVLEPVYFREIIRDRAYKVWEKYK
jgi:predicted DNA-binding transcriptional regulator YafY